MDFRQYAKQGRWRAIQHEIESFIVFGAGYDTGAIIVDAAFIGSWHWEPLTGDKKLWKADVVMPNSAKLMLSSNNPKVLRYKIMIALIENEYEESLK